MDVNAACAGSLYALRLASNLQGKVAVVAAETVSRFCANTPGDWCSAIFGDGAGAVIFEAPAPFMGAMWGTAPEGWNWMTVLPPDQFGRMDGRKLFEAAVPLCAAALEHACRLAGLAPSELDLIVPHQANLRLLEALAARVGVPMARVVTTVQHTGNLSSASLLVALASALRHQGAGRSLRVGLVAFGAGLTYGAAVCEIEPRG
jgi:3-oxoacyl-[acyl-carrier-protein] synthase-3